MELDQKTKLYLASVGVTTFMFGGYLLYMSLSNRKQNAKLLEIADEHYAAIRVMVRNGKAVAVVPADLTARSEGAIATHPLRAPTGPVSHGPSFIPPDGVTLPASAFGQQGESRHPVNEGMTHPAVPTKAEAEPVKNPDPADLGIPDRGFRPTELPGD